jgi:hypothetical protein
MLIFRNDDVNPNTPIDEVREIYDIIKEYFPDSEIYSCVNIFAKTSDNKSAYPVIPMKEINFQDVDKIFNFNHLGKLENIVSHGLFHLDHKTASRDLQEFSIISSCKLLNTDVFIPPFWRWNQETAALCKEHNIKLWVDEDWVNIERLPVDKTHTHYLFHSWRFTPETFRQRLESMKL